MTLTDFQTLSSFSTQPEIRRVALLAFYLLRQKGAGSFTVAEVATWLSQMGFPKPNGTRLTQNLKKSKLFTKSGKESFQLHPTAVEALDGEFPGLRHVSEEPVAHDSVIPLSLLQKKRTYLTSIITQINASYENNIFDGCAVLMRRLLEILLILAYEELKIDPAIREQDGSFKMLNPIIDNALGNTTLKLSKSSKESLHPFRKLGNFSAHKIYYNALRSTIDSNILDYRALIEELLYKSNLRT